MTKADKYVIMYLLSCENQADNKVLSARSGAEAKLKNNKLTVMQKPRTCKACTVGYTGIYACGVSY